MSISQTALAIAKKHQMFTAELSINGKFKGRPRIEMTGVISDALHEKFLCIIG